MGAIETCNFDLHCHSTISDGMLAPAAVVRRAAANGVSVLALTDHDELAGLAEATAAARANDIRFVPGVEISVTWAETTIHIVGLGIDPANANLVAQLAHLRASRGGAPSASPRSSTGWASRAPSRAPTRTPRIRS